MKKPRLPLIENPEDFPDTNEALLDPPGLLAASFELSAEWLKHSYPKGVFPWYSPGEPVLWWSTDPRTVLFVEEFKLHRSLQKTMKKYAGDPARRITLNFAFEEVILACAQPRDGANGTWITDEVRQAYIGLHKQGFAHSVEHWHNGDLVGGLYCVSFGKMIYGESMFSRQTDASKVAFCALVYWLKRQNVRIIDCQQATRHLLSLGARTLERPEFEAELKLEISKPTLDWSPCELGWIYDAN